MSMEWIRFLLTTVFVLAGLAVCCIGVYGMFRFGYAANRMHAAATIDTLGIALTCIGFAISAPDLFTALKILLVVAFWWLSSPVASHLLCRLEIITDEQRSEYMVVHKHSMEEERTEERAAEAVTEAAAEDDAPAAEVENDAAEETAQENEEAAEAAQADEAQDTEEVQPQ